MTPPFIPKVYGPDDTQFFDSDILSSPIEHDDTEVSEYSDWTELTSNTISAYHPDHETIPEHPRSPLKTPVAAKSHSVITPLSTPYAPTNQATSIDVLTPIQNNQFRLHTSDASSTSEYNAPSDSVSYSEE